MTQNYTILTAVEHHSHVCHLISKPPHHPHHSTIIHTWLMCGNICMLMVMVNRQVTTVIQSKHIMLLLLHYFSYACSGNIVGQNQEFWTDAGKWHFKEQYMQHNYVLILWAIYQDQKKWKILAGKWHLGTMWIEVSLC